jgi:hypothetical protein
VSTLLLLVVYKLTQQLNHKSYLDFTYRSVGGDLMYSAGLVRVCTAPASPPYSFIAGFQNAVWNLDVAFFAMDEYRAAAAAFPTTFAIEAMARSPRT